MSTSGSGDSVASPLLSTSELADMATFGTERATQAGDLLFQAGEASYDLFVVLEGEVKSFGPTARMRFSSPSTGRAASSAS